MLLLDKFFSCIKYFLSAETILELSGDSPPDPSTDTLEGINRNLYDELSLFSGRILYPCETEYHTVYRFYNMKLPMQKRFVPYFVENNGSLEILSITSSSPLYRSVITRYSIEDESLSIFDGAINISYDILYDIEYSTEDSAYRVSTMTKQTIPPYSFRFLDILINTDLSDSEFTSVDSFRYRGFKTYSSTQIEIFPHQNNFNLQLIGDLYYFSLGHKIFIFDENFSVQKIIFLNNSNLLGTSDEYYQPRLTGRQYARFERNFCKSYIYNNEAYVCNCTGNLERYKIG